MRKTAFWILIFMTMMLFILTVIKPAVKNNIEVVSEKELYPIGTNATETDEDGESWYVVMKKEVKDWIEILCKASPLITAISAFAIKKKIQK